MATKKDKRPSIPDKVKYAVWGASAGRCTICNKYVIDNDDMGEAVPIGELAHNIGWGEKSPRGEVSGEIDTSSADNLLLLCRNCHKPTDTKTERYTEEKLRQLKIDHENRIKRLTEIGADRSAVVVRMVGAIRNVPPELTYDTVLDALVSEGYFPELLPNAHRTAVEIDLRDRVNAGTPEYFAESARHIEGTLNMVLDGVRLNSTSRIAVFGFARVPLLVHLGARLDDKVNTLIFQRQRGDAANAWRWPDKTDKPSELKFTIDRSQKGTDKTKVAVIANLSGTILPEELPEHISDDYTVYTITPSTPSNPGPSLIDSQRSLASFERTARELFALVERDHGKIPYISLFPAVPLSGAITLGRVLMPDVSPALHVFDRDEDNQFFMALEVKK